MRFETALTVGRALGWPFRYVHLLAPWVAVPLAMALASPFWSSSAWFEQNFLTYEPNREHFLALFLAYWIGLSLAMSALWRRLEKDRPAWPDMRALLPGLPLSLLLALANAGCVLAFFSMFSTNSIGLVFLLPAIVGNAYVLALFSLALRRPMRPWADMRLLIWPGLNYWPQFSLLGLIVFALTFVLGFIGTFGLLVGADNHGLLLVALLAYGANVLLFASVGVAIARALVKTSEGVGTEASAVFD